MSICCSAKMNNLISLQLANVASQFTTKVKQLTLVTFQPQSLDLRPHVLTDVFNIKFVRIQRYHDIHHPPSLPLANLANQLAWHHVLIVRSEV